MIRRSLVLKLALAFLLVGIVTTLLLAVSIRITSTDRLNQLIIDQQVSGLQAELTSYYTNHGSWDGIQAQWDALNFTPIGIGTNNAGNGMPMMGRDMHGNFRDRRTLFGLADENGIVLISVDNNAPAGARLSQSDLASGTPLVIDNRQVGTILIAKTPPGLNQEESLFLDRTNQALLIAGSGALLVALVMGIFLSRSLTKPLKALTQAAQKIADGQLEQQVAVSSKDEIGRLANTFNRMSQEVARANQQRRQMTADIAHDLRTPLTVIAGYVEAMRDKVLPPTPERLDLIYNEIERLQSMVGDLRMLSQVDAGELPLTPQTIAPIGLLQHAVDLFQHQAQQKGIALAVESSSGASLPEIQVDEARMMQVLDNLLSNAFRYTPEGGKIILAARQKDACCVQLMVQDTGSGIAEEELSAIFERFHRADRSRHSETGESGLGLAIVKALVEAQHGRVWAESGLGKGTTIFMEFPV